MADDTDTTVDARTETTALRDALAAEHAAVWGYGVVGAALAPNARQPAADSEAAHRDVRDRLPPRPRRRAGGAAAPPKARPGAGKGGLQPAFPRPVGGGRPQARRRPGGRRRLG